MRAFTLLIAAACIIRMQAQELVPNGDFEQYNACPDSLGQIYRATGWSSPTAGSSNYFNACYQGVPTGFNPFNVSVPDNYFGHQPSHSGNGYAGFFCLDSVATVPNSDYKEYVSHALTAPLTPGAVYNVEFFVNLADRSALSVNDLGALLSIQMPHRDDTYPITATPQVTNNSLVMLDDSIGWTRIRGCFTADSGYAYITIGSFPIGAAAIQEQGTTSFPPVKSHSYYYVDDVSVQHWPRPELGPDITICEATPIMVQNPISGVNYLWSTGEIGTGITVDTPGIYSVQIDDAGCPLSDTIIVAAGIPVTFGLPTDTLVDLCATPQILLYARPDPPYAEVTWSTGDTTTSVMVDASGTYVIHADAPDRCAASASITVIDTCWSPVYAPNAFTPNGDGINDQWRPIWSGNKVATIEWTIFDRWGQVIYSSTGLDSAWDGNAAGKPVPSGIYAWRGHTHDPITRVDRELKGQIVLVR
ncbi:MAG: T9SS type B sorting domain-containing protein [Flavobacteriales bacterium]